jgi:phosphatidate cytidylyltransferase
VACGVVLSLGATWGPHWLSAAGAKSSLVHAVPQLEHAFAVSVLLVLLVRTVRFRQPGGHLAALGAEVLTIAYAGLLLAVTAQLRWLGPSGNGYLALGSLIAATKMGDVGAYSLGRMFGRRKMSPYVSPGKTWMGAVGAVLGGLIGGVLWLQLAAPWFGLTWQPEWWVYASAYGAALGVAGMLSDLCESLLKRDARVKDGAALMPGFGGMLDLLDSILFTGPLAVILWRLFLGTCTS